MITQCQTSGRAYDERCEGWVDYDEFRVYRKSTNMVYETVQIASKATGVTVKEIEKDIHYLTKEWNRIGNAFFDRKYNYYKCPENFIKSKRGKKRAYGRESGAGGETILLTTKEPRKNDFSSSEGKKEKKE